VGDPASVPAINSLLDELRVADDAAGRTTPVTAWLEYQHDTDPSLELRTGESDVVSWIPRKRDGAALVDAVCEALAPDAVSVGEDYFWVACEASSTRAIVKHLRKVLGVDRQRINALGYWRVT
jgi:NADPH-dependent ferric siderophore reductase